MNRSPIKRKPRKKKPGDDPKFLFFVRQLPCVCCYKEIYEVFRREPAQLLVFVQEQQEFGRQESRTEAAHLGRSASRRGLKQRFPDNEAGPLCGEAHHRTGDASIHKLGPGFWSFHGLDRDLVIDQIQGLYAESLK